MNGWEVLIENTKYFIVLLIDRSGSMKNVENQIINSILNFINLQKYGNLTKLLTIKTFDDKIEVLKNCIEKNINDIKDSDIKKKYFEPRGRTRLIDTLIEESIYLYEELKTLKNSRGIIAVLTDSIDNMSINKPEKLRNMINKFQDSGLIDFIFLGSTEKSIKQPLGFNDEQILYYNQRNIYSAVECLSNEITRLTSDGIKSGFTQNERAISK